MTWTCVFYVLHFLHDFHQFSISDGLAYSFGVLLPPLVDYYDSNRGTVSWVGSLLCGVYLMSGPIVGGLVNKFGCRFVCILGSVVACIGKKLKVVWNFPNSFSDLSNCIRHWTVHFESKCPSFNANLWSHWRIWAWFDLSTGSCCGWVLFWIQEGSCYWHFCKHKYQHYM